MLKQPRTFYLSLMTLLMIGFFALRVMNLLSFPLFIDETLAIQRAEATRMGDPLFFAGQGKVLLPWVASIFVTEGSEIFVIRYITLLIVMTGVASVVRIADAIGGWLAASLGILLVAFNPMLHFHDRLAIADSTLHPILTLFALCLLLAFSKHSPKWSMLIISGCLFVGALLAKATALVMIPLPFVAAVLLANRWSIRQRITGTLMVYGTILILWMPFYVFALMRGVDYFGRAAGGSSGILFNWVDIMTNLQFMWNAYEGYLGLLAFVLVVGSVCSVVWHTRKVLFLLSFGIGFAIALVIVGDVLYYRYWVVNVPVLSALSAIALTAIPEQRLRWIAIGLVLSGFAVIGLPFAWQVNHAPLTATLPATDYGQYFQYDSAGTGLVELATILEDIPEPVLGAFIGCDSLEYYVSSSVDLTCLSLSSTEADRIDRFNSAMDVTSYAYIILETPGYIEFEMVDINGNVTEQINRPDDISQITLYRIMR